MKKIMILTFLAMLSAIFFTVCKYDTEIDLDDDSQNADRVWTDRVEWTEDVEIIGLPVGNYAYIRSIIPFDSNINEISIITVSNETVYGAVAIWGIDLTDSIISFFSIDLDTESIFIYPSSTNLTGGGNSVRAIAADNDGNIFFVNHKKFYNGDSQSSKEALLLSQIDASGNIGFSVDVTEYLGFSNNIDFVTPPRSIVLDDVGNIYVIADNGSISLFDSTGAYQFFVPHPEGIWTQATGTPFQGVDGNMLFPIWDSNEGNILYSINNETLTLNPQLQFPDMPDVFAFSPDLHGNELFLMSNIGVYSYCLESGEQNRVFHWLEVDTPPSIIFPAGEGRFILLDYSDNSMIASAIVVLTRIDILDDTRTIVTMASLSPNLRFVHEFNSQSTEYRIVVLDYSDNNITAALTRFSIDMIAGKIPDIIDFTYLDFRNLANSGFLADINIWFDYDDNINRTNFHERVFELLEVEGNLYAVAPSFMITTCLAPASLVGTTPGMTLERLMLYDVQFNDGNSLLQDLWAQAFIDMHTMVSRRELIDFNMGTVHFETDSFIQVLDYANKLKYDETILTDDEYNPFEINIRRGNDYISAVMINYLDQLYQIELYAGKQITPVGFPVNDGVGSLMLPVSLFGIGEGAQNPSGAWAFLKFMLTTMQNEMLYGIPVSRIIFDEWVNHSMNPPLIGDNPHLSNEVFIDGVLVELIPITQAQVNRTLDMIETLGDVLVDGDEVVMHVVAEEVGAFLRSNRSAEDTARVIQNRVQRYVDERQG